MAKDSISSNSESGLGIVSIAHRLSALVGNSSWETLHGGLVTKMTKTILPCLGKGENFFFCTQKIEPRFQDGEIY